MKNAHIHPDSTCTDKYLWDMIRADSVDAFNEVYNRYWGLLFHVTMKRLQVKEIAEEIVQDTFIILWEKRHDIEISALKPYLFAITRYAVFHYLASKQTIASRMKTLAHMSEADSSKGADVEALVNDRLLLQLIETVASELPEKSRQVFYYNKLLDYSISQAAETFNISQKTAEGHLTKALKILRLKLSALHTVLF
ncbi:sigma-70 family RNA polymerase sigma factor [Chitinophaga filiformis]|uniref:sigma-70 family RNA polymerase sigma factor n=1 Tax=Chitinophaga filiformis TaxID=104663 RepID=UPI001F2D2F8C|nr:sigma-70 family RNA polymerase sigma factor [Chitinophaga filiformis]MCF6406530.1 sigma-70 family RNA polymerase sigma factor [Chitinophaga filiformis]